MHYVLPGATHTRFPHALRQMDLTRSAINQQLHQWEFRISVEEADIRGIIVSSLLDSLGKYQFLHMFQDFLNFRGEVPEAGILADAEVRDLLVERARAFLPTHRLRRTHLENQSTTIFKWIGKANLAWQRNPGDRTQGFLAGLRTHP